MLRAILKHGLMLAIAICGIFFTPFVASAQPPCGTREDVTGLLSNKYEESQDAVGVTANGGLIEVWVNREEDSWSIIVTTPQGWSCLVAAGSGWQSLNPAPAGQQM